jgi:hypothetical protein
MNSEYLRNGWGSLILAALALVTIPRQPVLESSQRRVVAASSAGLWAALSKGQGSNDAAAAAAAPAPASGEDNTIKWVVVGATVGVGLIILIASTVYLLKSLGGGGSGKSGKGSKTSRRFEDEGSGRKSGVARKGKPIVSEE